MNIMQVNVKKSKFYMNFQLNLVQYISSFIFLMFLWMKHAKQISCNLQQHDSGNSKHSKSRYANFLDSLWDMSKRPVGFLAKFCTRLLEMRTFGSYLTHGLTLMNKSTVLFLLFVKFYHKYINFIHELKHRWKSVLYNKQIEKSYNLPQESSTNV